MNDKKFLFLLQGLQKNKINPDQWWPSDSRFERMIGAILAQNTSWHNAQMAMQRIGLAEAMNPEEILTISKRQLQYLIRPSGFFKQKTEYLRAFCWWYLMQGGYTKLASVPTAKLRSALLKLKGIGPETADDILVYAFKRPGVIIDNYTRRLLKRTGVINGSESDCELRAAIAKCIPQSRLCHQQTHASIVEHCKEHCTKHPRCENCPMNNYCDKQI